MGNAHANSTIGGWCILTDRYGSDVQHPTQGQIRTVVDDLYNRRQDDHEHGSITMRLGLEDGSMYVLEARISKAITFSKFADQDYDELMSECRLELADEATIVRLLDLLSNGNIEGARKLVPSCGW